MVCADRSEHVEFAGAVHSGHFRSEGLRDLHGERTNVSAGTVDQHPMSGLDRPLGAKTLQGHDSRLRYGRRRLERQPARLRGECILRSAHVLREGSETVLGQVSKDLVSRSECLRVPSDRLYHTGHVQPEASILRHAQPGAEASELRPSQEIVDFGHVDRRRTNANQNFVFPRNGYSYLFETKDVR